MTARTEKKFMEHLVELQWRLLISAICVGIGATIAYFYNEQILSFLVRPLGGPLYYTTPTGGFDLVFKVSLTAGIFLTSPILVYEILAFFEPALPENFTPSITKFLLLSWVLLLMGIATAYYMSLPAALRLLNEFGSTHVKALISTKEYFSFIISYLGGFALVFQLPVIFLLINKIKPLKPKKLLKYLRHVILVSFIIAAILTPTPDPINQTIMAAPMILLYVFSIFAIWVTNATKRKRVAAEEAIDATPEEFFPIHGALLLASGQLMQLYPGDPKRHFRYLR